MADFINENHYTLGKKISSQFQVTYVFLEADRLIISNSKKGHFKISLEFPEFLWLSSQRHCKQIS